MHYPEDRTYGLSTLVAETRDLGSSRSERLGTGSRDRSSNVSWRDRCRHRVPIVAHLAVLSGADVIYAGAGAGIPSADHRVERRRAAARPPDGHGTRPARRPARGAGACALPQPATASPTQRHSGRPPWPNWIGLARRHPCARLGDRGRRRHDRVRVGGCLAPRPQRLPRRRGRADLSARGRR